MAVSRHCGVAFALLCLLASTASARKLHEDLDGIESFKCDLTTSTGTAGLLGKFNGCSPPPPPSPTPSPPPPPATPSPPPPSPSPPPPEVSPPKEAPAPAPEAPAPEGPAPEGPAPQPEVPAPAPEDAQSPVPSPAQEPSVAPAPETTAPAPAPASAPVPAPGPGPAADPPACIGPLVQSAVGGVQQVLQTGSTLSAVNAIGQVFRAAADCVTIIKGVVLDLVDTAIPRLNPITVRASVFRFDRAEGVINGEALGSVTAEAGTTAANLEFTFPGLPALLPNEDYIVTFDTLGLNLNLGAVLGSLPALVTTTPNLPGSGLVEVQLGDLLEIEGTTQLTPTTGVGLGITLNI